MPSSISVLLMCFVASVNFQICVLRSLFDFIITSEAKKTIKYEFVCSFLGNSISMLLKKHIFTDLSLVFLQELHDPVEASLESTGHGGNLC